MAFIAGKKGTVLIVIEHFTLNATPGAYSCLFTFFSAHPVLHAQNPINVHTKAIFAAHNTGITISPLVTFYINIASENQVPIHRELISLSSYSFIAFNQ
jgi:hypothetical protein